jgi:predicted ATPase
MELLPNEFKEEDIEIELRKLEELNIIIIDSKENMSYTFSNTLVKDVVYGLMLFSQRRQLHRMVVGKSIKKSFD